MTGPGVDPRAYWSCFSSMDEMDRYARYRDVLGVKYAYDATVPNHKAVKSGDVLLLRDRDLVYGHGTVTEVDAELGSKRMSLCPRCHRSGPSERLTC